MTKTELTKLIKAKAVELGFDYCGIAKADYLEEEAPRLKKWLNQGLNGEMAYLGNTYEKLVDPRRVVDGAKSVICLAQSYFTNKHQSDSKAPRICKYAYGKDHHRVLRDRLELLLKYIREAMGEVNGKTFVDSELLMEKAWGARAGLGWIGKHGILINREIGSFLFLSELVVDQELEYDSPIDDRCANCRLCIDACPNGAIVSDRVIDARKCIAYLTIELKGELPQESFAKLHGRAFGCDICQDVCPWNREAKEHHELLFEPQQALLEMTAAAWYEMTPETFKRLFQDTAIARTGYSRLKRNIDRVRQERKSGGVDV